MQLAPENVEKITLASCALHKVLRDKASSRYTPAASLDIETEKGRVTTGSWRSEQGQL